MKNKQVKKMIASETLGEWILVASGVKALLHQVVQARLYGMNGTTWLTVNYGV